MLFALMLLQAATAPEANATAPKSDDDKKVCRIAGITGSRLGGQRVCHTRREWAVIDREQQLATGQAKANARGN